MGAFRFWAHRKGIRTRKDAPRFKGLVQKNAKYEYCYHFSSRVFKASEGKSNIKTTTDSPDGQYF